MTVDFCPQTSFACVFTEGQSKPHGELVIFILSYYEKQNTPTDSRGCYAKWAKNKSPPISMKFGDILESTLTKM